jgi:hypothetical protein
METAMVDQAFEERVREDIWAILSRKYNTVRHGGHPADAGEYLHERTFWPDMRFHEAKVTKGPGGPQIRITFTPVDAPDSIYGYKVDVQKAADAWSKRVGIREPRQNPSMFAAELIWYMVAYVGSIQIESQPKGEDGVRWINTGADVFTPLPEPEELHHRA